MRALLSACDNQEKPVGESVEETSPASFFDAVSLSKEPLVNRMEECLAGYYRDEAGIDESLYDVLLAAGHFFEPETGLQVLEGEFEVPTTVPP